jgi:hypothetical protein
LSGVQRKFYAPFSGGLAGEIPPAYPTTLILSCWHIPNRSLVQASQSIRKSAFTFAFAINSFSLLLKVLEHFARAISAGCRINKRAKTPSFFQLIDEAIG